MKHKSIYFSFDLKVKVKITLSISFSGMEPIVMPVFCNKIPTNFLVCIKFYITMGEAKFLLYNDGREWFYNCLPVFLLGCISYTVYTYLISVVLCG